MKNTVETHHGAGKAPVKVGDLVTVGVGPRSFKGLIVEDRGAIGADGRRLYRIGVAIDEERTDIELPEESFGDRTSLSSDQYIHELFEAIIDVAKRSNAEIIVSFNGHGDVQVRGRTMLPNIAARTELVEEMHDLLAEEANLHNGRVVLSPNNPPPGSPSKQTRFAVRET